MKYNEPQYIDAMVTLELAVKFAEQDRRGTAKVIRDCWRELHPRVDNELNRRIFDGLCTQLFPLGALRMLRRQFDEAVSK